MPGSVRLLVKDWHPNVGDKPFPTVGGEQPTIVGSLHHRGAGPKEVGSRLETRGGSFHWNSPAGGQPAGKTGWRFEHPRGRGAGRTANDSN